MTKEDITEKLRNLVHISQTIDEEWVEWACTDMDEARKEIERLRQELAEVESCLWRIQPNMHTVPCEINDFAEPDPFEGTGEMYKDAYERLREKCDKQAKILQAAFPEQSGHYFICGEGGVLDENGLPEMILISPTYGAGWFLRYDKTEHYGGKG